MFFVIWYDQCVPRSSLSDMISNQFVFCYLIWSLCWTCSILAGECSLMINMFNITATVNKCVLWSLLSTSICMSYFQAVSFDPRSRSLLFATCCASPICFSHLVHYVLLFSMYVLQFVLLFCLFVSICLPIAFPVCFNISCYFQ